MAKEKKIPSQQGDLKDKGFFNGRAPMGEMTIFEERKKENSKISLDSGYFHWGAPIPKVI